MSSGAQARYCVEWYAIARKGPWKGEMRPHEHCTKSLPTSFAIEKARTRGHVVIRDLRTRQIVWQSMPTPGIE